MADSNKPIVPGGDTVGTVGEVYLSKNGKTYECVAVIDNTTVTPNGETIPRVEYVWVCTDDGAGGGAFPFDVSDAEPITISRTKEELISAIDAGKTPIGYWRHTQSNGTVIRLFHFVKRFDVANGTNLTFYFSDKTSSGVLDIRADGTIQRIYQNNDGGGASGSANFTFTITPTNGPGSQMLSATRAEMLAALDAGKTLLGYWTETRTILETTDTIKHEFRLESVSGAGASRGLAFVNYEQFYKSTLYVNGNDTVSFVNKEVLPAPMTKTEAMTQSVGMDDDGRLWTEPGASGGGGVQPDWNQNDETATDYVKNRPGGYTVVTKKGIDIKWDGVIGDREYIDSGGGVLLVKVSDEVPTSEQLSGAEIIQTINDGVQTTTKSFTIDGNKLVDDGGSLFEQGSLKFMVVGEQATATSGYSAGTYILHMIEGGATAYVSSIYKQDETGIVPIPEEYIDDSIQRVGADVIIQSSTPDSTKKFKITVDDTGTLSATEVTNTTT